MKSVYLLHYVCLYFERISDFTEKKYKEYKNIQKIQNTIKELLDEEISMAKLKNNKKHCISDNCFANPIIELMSNPCITIYKMY